MHFERFLEDHAPSGALLSGKEQLELQFASRQWYDTEICHQTTAAIKKRLSEIGVKGDQAGIGFLDVSRAQYQTLTGAKGLPTREILQHALLRCGIDPSQEIDKKRKRLLMIQRSVSQFQNARSKRNEPICGEKLSPEVCDETVRQLDIPSFESFVNAPAWNELVHNIHSRFDISCLSAVGVTDWLFGRFFMEGFRSHLTEAIFTFGDISNVELTSLIESKQAKVGTIFKLYFGFNGAKNRAEAFRRLQWRKPKSESIFDQLFEYTGLEATDFEPIVSPLPLLLFKSRETRHYVRMCLKKMAMQLDGEQDGHN